MKTTICCFDQHRCSTSQGADKQTPLLWTKDGSTSKMVMFLQREWRINCFGLRENL